MTWTRALVAATWLACVGAVAFAAWVMWRLYA